ncbi:nicotinamide N-methyltransferase [Xenopus laevis]|uniref:Uncharacterized protein n=2 Tax=Xenopus laevis TaxID=8355 RepID=A0A974C5M9_XENLA|nr:nicotinamide N-methyltransferase [Xenopus laevis]OCT66971.1 hypothetical protein XELAEV_18038253mg [Xenopus laevis]
MSCIEHKGYHDEEFNPCHLFDTYGGIDKTISKEELVENPLKFFYNIFSSGCVKGDMLFDISVGSSVYSNFVAVDYFKNIILLESSDCCINAKEKWIRNEPGAVEHSHVAEFVCFLKGQSTEWKEHEEKTRRAIKQVVKWDITKENPLGAVVLPQADCLTSWYYLEAVSKDQYMYINLLKKFSSLLKIGGHLFLFAAINVSYYTIGQHKFAALKCDEEFIRKAITEAGFIIESSQTHKSNLKSQMIDYESVACFVCRKDRLV